LEYRLKTRQIIKFLLMVLLIVCIGFMLEPILVNIQLLVNKPSLFPRRVDFNYFDVIMLIIASMVSIINYHYFPMSKWWIGFLVMLTPFLAFKYMGAYFDQTNYIIAESEGRRVGGGAAFGHLYLLFYLFGSAQMLNFLAYRFLKK
jgi:hypothetical protein